MKNYVATDKWDKIYLEFAAFIAFHKRMPAIKNNPELYMWLSTQRGKYDRGTLEAEGQYQKLTSSQRFGFNLSSKAEEGTIT